MCFGLSLLFIVPLDVENQGLILQFNVKPL
jgi:hypothetical protein